VPYLWLLLFFLIPFVIVLKISFSETQMRDPPYLPLLQWSSDRLADIHLHLNPGNFFYLWEDSLYLPRIFEFSESGGDLNGVRAAIAYPLAYCIAPQACSAHHFIDDGHSAFWTSLLLRVYAWIGFSRNNGLINNLLLWLGVIDHPIVMLQTNFAVYLGIVYSICRS